MAREDRTHLVKFPGDPDFKVCLVCGRPESWEGHWTLVLLPGGHLFMEAPCVCLPDPGCPRHRVLRLRAERPG
jgi:hypothetical protein